MHTCFLILPLIQLNTMMITRGVCPEERSGNRSVLTGGNNCRGSYESEGLCSESNKAETDIAIGRE